jgi:hypothetical protein
VGVQCQQGSPRSAGECDGAESVPRAAQGNGCCPDSHSLECFVAGQGGVAPAQKWQRQHALHPRSSVRWWRRVQRSVQGCSSNRTGRARQVRRSRMSVESSASGEGDAEQRVNTGMAASPSPAALPRRWRGRGEKLGSTTDVQLESGMARTNARGEVAWRRWIRHGTYGVRTHGECCVYL